MRKRIKQCISIMMVMVMCLSCLMITTVNAAEEDVKAEEILVENYAEVPEEDGAYVTTDDISEEAAAEVPTSAQELIAADPAAGDEAVVSATALVQASKSSQDPPYVGGATTMESGPANKRTPKTYYLDINEHNYPIWSSIRYFDYMQSVGILYPGDKLVIIPENDPNPGTEGCHGTPGISLKTGNDWLDLATGDHMGPLLISKAPLYGPAVPHYYVQEITVVDEPVMFNYSGSGNAGTSCWAVQYEAEPGVRGASYWSGSTMVWVSMPKYHPIEYAYYNETARTSYMQGQRTKLTDTSQMKFDGENPTVIFAEDLSCSYNPIDRWTTVGPVFKIYHPQMKGYMFKEVYATNDTNADRNYEPTLESVSEDGTHSTWRFFFKGANDYNWSFDNQKHGSEEDPIKLNVSYYEAKTVTLNANGGKVDNKTEVTYPFKYKEYSNWYWNFIDDDRFDLSKYVPVKDGDEFLGWYADKACTKLVSAADSRNMYSDFYKYLSNNNICQKDGDENCAENVDLYAGWKNAPAITGFTDVQDPSHPYYKAIYWASDNGITKGYSDGTFGIDKSCSRGEMIMFLWRFAEKPVPKTVSKSPFKDVPTNHSFYKAVLWAYQTGVTKGYSDGTFGINRNISRGECMMFLWRVKKKPAPKAVTTSPFKDVQKTHAFYNAILWGSQNGITKGYTSGARKGEFGINDNCTRGQIVTFLYRAK